LSAARRWNISRQIGRMRGDRRALWLLVLASAAMWGWNWLQTHPGDNPWAPLDLRDEPGWATGRKIAALRDDPQKCRAVLERSEVAFTSLAPLGEGACRREDRTRLDAYPLHPQVPATSCAVAAALQVWFDQSVQPAARASYGQGVVQIAHLGSYSCRRLYGRSEGPWSEHAAANAIDISGFVLTDGTRISLAADWDGKETDEAFLTQVRDGACEVFGTVLSPDYNAAHRDHLHLDQAARGFGGVCR
jgi:hypothetical protein